MHIKTFMKVWYITGDLLQQVMQPTRSAQIQTPTPKLGPMFDAIYDLSSNIDCKFDLSINQLMLFHFILITSRI